MWPMGVRRKTRQIAVCTGSGHFDVAWWVLMPPAVSVSSSTTAASGYGRARNAASIISSPPSPHARGTRTRPTGKERPQEWHS